MKGRKGIGIDLLIELVGAAIVSVIAWLATTASSTIEIPPWAIVTIAAAVTAAVALLVAYLIRARHLSRMEAELREIKDANQAAMRNLRLLRDSNRAIGEHLRLGDEPTTLKSTTSYTVDPVGQDRIESVWNIAYKEQHQGRVFTTEDWSSEPIAGRVSCNCQTDGDGTVIPILVVDEPTYKQFVLHLHPPVGTTERKLEVRQTWPDLWKDLRTNGKDYVELTARPGLQEAVIHVHIPASLGQFHWEANGDPAIELSEGTTGAQQTLTFSVKAPQAGAKYRADLARV